ncbi:MAG: efflux RND transporter periplasmic adaptor subunit [Chloroflexota bacterium]
MMKTKNKNRMWWMIGGGLLVVVLVGFGFLRNNNAAEAQAPQTGDIVTVTRGELSASATASGEVVAQSEANLSFQASGTVNNIFVRVGDTVQAGDAIFKLDTAELERNVADAEQALLIQEANVATLTASASEADVRAAEANVLSAQLSLNDLLDGPNETDIATAEANLRAAEADLSAAYARLNSVVEAADPDEVRAAEIELSLAQQEATSAAEQHSTILVTESEFISEDQLADLEESARAAAVQANADLAAAQETLERLLNGDPNSIAAAQASVNVSIANRDSAQAQYDMTMLGASDAQIAAAELSLAQAEATLANLLDGASDVQIARAQIQVEQARLNLAQTQINLDNATLLAPFEGVVTAVNVSVGEVASGTLAELVDIQSLEVVLEVDEVDIGEISIGQEAFVTLETWPDDSIPATVSSIAPKNAASQGNSLVTYEVYLTLDQSDLPILIGMTANANLTTATRSDVLLVQSQAITADRQAGKFFVTVVNGEAQEVVEVTIGLRDGALTEITSGLSEGDQLLIQNSAPTFEIPTGPGGGSPFDG